MSMPDLTFAIQPVPNEVFTKFKQAMPLRKRRPKQEDLFVVTLPAPLLTGTDLAQEECLLLHRKASFDDNEVGLVVGAGMLLVGRMRHCGKTVEIAPLGQVPAQIFIDFAEDAVQYYGQLLPLPR